VIGSAGREGERDLGPEDWTELLGPKGGVRGRNDTNGPKGEENLKKDGEFGNNSHPQ